MRGYGMTLGYREECERLREHSAAGLPNEEIYINPKSKHGRKSSITLAEKERRQQASFKKARAKRKKR